ncbi:winged helix-turn-helix transcriptional regulator [Halorubellus salinus]|uniref:winged helix-turn-helix transcriptional regulator n=1 Tax=Halorubellus salinus TaxID=755309 RepID=UPI001D07E89E|nr:winged helix-turn-helix transcriptional regulator [Halorubellus salinus]
MGLPEQFEDEFDEKGEKFFEIAEILFQAHNRQYTQSELAERIDRSNQTVSNHTQEMVNSGWLERKDDQTTFAWNTGVHHPSATEGTTAIKSFYVDLWGVIREHSKTAPGTFALLGFVMIQASIVLFAFYIGFSLHITQTSTVPPLLYVAIGLGSFLTGVLVTFLSPIQAIVNGFALRVLPDDLFQREK